MLLNEPNLPNILSVVLVGNIYQFFPVGSFKRRKNTQIEWPKNMTWVGNQVEGPIIIILEFNHEFDGKVTSIAI